MNNKKTIDNFHWTKEQEKWLKDNNDKYNGNEIVKEFNKKFNTNKSKESLYVKRRRLGLVKFIHEIYLENEEKYLLDNYGGNKTYEELIKEFEILFGKPITLDKISYFYKKHNINKIFKPRIVYTTSIGEEKMLDGYWCVRIANKRNGGRENYKRKHILVWEKYHKCKVPKDHYILFKDNNKNNFDINNLACVSNRTLSMLNWNDWNDKGEITETAIMLGELMDLNDKERDENECSK